MYATMPYLLESLNHHLFKVGVRRCFHVVHSIEAEQSNIYLKLPYRNLEVKLKYITYIAANSMISINEDFCK